MEHWQPVVVRRVNDALAGSYNEAGRDRWWRRPLPRLNTETPLDVLLRANGADDPLVTRLIEIAERLRG